MTAEFTDKQKRNHKFVVNVAADLGVTITPNSAIEHWKRIMSNLPDGTNEDCVEVYEAAKEYFAN